MEENKIIVKLPTPFLTAFLLMASGASAALHECKAPEPTVVAGQTGEKLDQTMKDFTSRGWSGVVMVELRGSVILQKGYGLADRKRRIPNSPSTRFEIGSLTKPFTAAAILKLVDQGKLDRLTKLGSVIGPLPPPKDRATIHHLATHTAGLVKEGADVDEASRDAFLANIRSLPADSLPGEKYRYTNAGYSVLAAVIEIISGQKYEDFLRQEILSPAALKAVYFRGESSNCLAPGYIVKPPDPTPAPAATMTWGTRGAGGLIMSVPELYRGFMALYKGTVLTKESRGVIFSPWPTEGYGWHVGKTANGEDFVQKGGGMPMYQAHLIHYPDIPATIVWATNSLHMRVRGEINQKLSAVVTEATQ